MCEANLLYAKNRNMVGINQSQLEVFGIKLRKSTMKAHSSSAF